MICQEHKILCLAVMTTFDKQSIQSKTVKFIGRGDSFGDTCLMNGSARECTTISKEFIELLVLRDEVCILLLWFLCMCVCMCLKCYFVRIE